MMRDQSVVLCCKLQFLDGLCHFLSRKKQQHQLAAVLLGPLFERLANNLEFAVNVPEDIVDLHKLCDISYSLCVNKLWIYIENK